MDLLRVDREECVRGFKSASCNVLRKLPSRVDVHGQ